MSFARASLLYLFFVDIDNVITDDFFDNYSADIKIVKDNIIDVFSY